MMTTSQTVEIQHDVGRKYGAESGTAVVQLFCTFEVIEKVHANK